MNTSNISDIENNGEEHNHDIENNGEAHNHDPEERNRFRMVGKI